MSCLHWNLMKDFTESSLNQPHVLSTLELHERLNWKFSKPASSPGRGWLHHLITIPFLLCSLFGSMQWLLNPLLQRTKIFIKEPLLQAFLNLPWSLEGEKIWWRLWRSEWQPLSARLVTWPALVDESPSPHCNNTEYSDDNTQYCKQLQRESPNPSWIWCHGLSSPPRDLSLFAAVPLPPSLRFPN